MLELSNNLNTFLLISGGDKGSRKNVLLKTPGLTITTTAGLAKKEPLNNYDETTSSSEECNRSTLDDYR